MRGNRRAFIFFVLAVLLLGAVTTIAVAWGCRWVTDERREAHRGLGPLNARELNDAFPYWGGEVDGTEAPDRGADGRQYVTNAVPPVEWAEWYGDGRYTDEPYSVDVGIDWIAVLSADFHHITESGGLWRPRQGWVSPDAEDWPPTERDVVPWWSSVESEPLVDDGAVIEMGIGWPLPAFVVTHRLPRAPVPWYALQRSTSGAVYGFPFGSSYRAQLPYRPLLAGFVLNTLLAAAAWTVVIGGVIMVPARLRHAWRRRVRRCASCGYRRHDDGGSRCSECGAMPGDARLPWRVAAVGALLSAFALLGAELIYAWSVAVHPDVPPIMQAAHDGDLDALQRLLAERGDDWGPMVPADAELERATRFADPPYHVRSEDALAGAMLGAQLDAVRLILDETGTAPPSENGTMTRAQWDVLSDVTRYGRLEFVAAVFDLYGWIVVDSSGDPTVVRPMPYAHFVGESLFKVRPAQACDLALHRMRVDATYHRHVWSEAVHDACERRVWDACFELAALGAPSGLDDRVVSSLSRSILSLGTVRRGDVERYGLDLIPIRRAAARALARAIEAASASEDQHAVTIAGPESIVFCMGIQSKLTHRNVVWFLQDLEYPSHVDPRRERQFWTSIREGWIDAERFAADWRALGHLTRHLNVNLPGPPGSDLPPLQGFCPDTIYRHIVAVLLDAGADVTDQIVFRSSDANRALIDAWLDAHAQPVHRHSARFPMAWGRP